VSCKQIAGDVVGGGEELQVATVHNQARPHNSQQVHCMLPVAYTSVLLLDWLQQEQHWEMSTV
jgi:hypothetical protein